MNIVPELFDGAVVKVADCECSSRRITFGVPYELLFANFKLVRSELKKWDGKTTIESNVSNAYYAIDEQTLPPGVKSNEIVTLAHVRDGIVFGGISYKISNPQKR